MGATIAIKPTRTSPLPDWRDLCEYSDAELAQQDIAAMNLACAVGLPGAEVIDAWGCLKALDDWAVGVRKVTERALGTEFRCNPGKYDFCEPLFRMVKLVLTLRNHCGVHYNPAKIGAKLGDPFELHEQFIYGAIQGPGGTCATLPVVYVAVGRRLGYPVRLVRAKGHEFCRWDDPVTGERVNIEGTNKIGVNSHSDAFYRTWPHPMTPAEEEACRYLKSLTPREELAEFVGRRGTQWREYGNFRRAIAARIESVLVEPSCVALWGNLRTLTLEWERRLLARRPPDFPSVEITLDWTRPRWPKLRWEMERPLRFFEAVENLLNDPELEEKCWAPLRAGQPPTTPLPKKIVVDCTGEAACSTHP